MMMLRILTRSSTTAGLLRDALYQLKRNLANCCKDVRKITSKKACSSRAEKVTMNCEDDRAVIGAMKLEVDVAKCADEAVCPVVIQPALTADESAQRSARRSSVRTAKKRSLLLPGELETTVNTTTSKYRIESHPEPAEDDLRDSAESTDDRTLSKVFEVKPDGLPPKKKRTYCRRQKSKKPSTERNLSDDAQNCSESVSRLLAQLVSTYCGDDGHPANCEECRNRIEMVRALLQSTGKCHAAGDPASSVSAVSQEANNTEMARNTSDTLMAAHLHMHAGEKDCDATSTGVSCPREQCVKRTGQRRHQCTLCDLSFTRPSLLNRHMSTHTAHRPHVCSVCGKAFAKPGMLQRHCKVVHLGERPVRRDRKRAPDDTQTCPDCGKTLSGGSSMKDHRFLHTGVRPYVCTVCGRSFTRYWHLTDHSVRHTGSRPHACDQCGATFSRRSSLKVHERLHTGELPFVCDVCGAAFAQSSNLLQHTRSSHTRDRPFVCSFCGERFMWAKDQRLHERRHHTLDKPFSCGVCARRFLTNYELGQHWQARHGRGEAPPPVKRRHQCSQCPASFAQNSSLQRNVRVHSTGQRTASDRRRLPSWHDRRARSNDRRSTQSEPRADGEQDDSQDSASSDEPRQHHCPHCELSFPRLAALSRHVRTHFGIPDSEDDDDK